MSGEDRAWPFERVLIANRGEIALRIVRACRDLGLKSVVAYTDADADAAFVALADHAWRLAGTTAAETYLNIDALMEIARKADAQAVHPGYGYLAESPEFAQAVAQAGLTWVGPNAQAIAQLGDKAGARAVAAAVGAPITPGSSEPIESVQAALEFAESIGYPVAVKAVYGGGGRGFRTAANAHELPEALQAAGNEALAAFGRSECLIEKQIVKPRHIETQCLADAHGNVRVVSTRDCSIQRRNQKILEEAPAPHLSSEQVDIVTRASRDVLKHVGYQGAATCEFLLGTDGTISFMEANARIQVEHTVTEEVTGVDLVAWQFRIAAGDQLPESFPAPRGHAFQFRINAEDPSNNFFPATGTVSALREPAGPGVRMDSGVSLGTQVGTAFDPMLAKLVITGPDRDTALARARRALAEYELEGVATLLPLHRELVNTPDFTTDFAVSTRWLEETFMPAYQGAAQVTTPPAEPASTDVIVEVDGHRLTVKVPAKLLADAQTVPTVKPAVRRKRTRAAAQAPAGNELTAPMQGTIVAVKVEQGQTVAAGDTVAIIEAMKMEQPLKATADTTVEGVHVAAGDAVKAGQPIVSFAD